MERLLLEAFLCKNECFSVVIYFGVVVSGLLIVFERQLTRFEFQDLGKGGLSTLDFGRKYRLFYPQWGNENLRIRY